MPRYTQIGRTLCFQVFICQLSKIKKNKFACLYVCMYASQSRATH